MHSFMMQQVTEWSLADDALNSQWWRWWHQPSLQVKVCAWCTIKCNVQNFIVLMAHNLIRLPLNAMDIETERIMWWVCVCGPKGASVQCTISRYINWICCLPGSFVISCCCWCFFSSLFVLQTNWSDNLLFVHERGKCLVACKRDHFGER